MTSSNVSLEEGEIAMDETDGSSD